MFILQSSVNYAPGVVLCCER